MASLEFVGKFIGGEEIQSVEVLKRKTPVGGNIIKFMFKSKTSVEIPERTAPYVITDKATDASVVQERRLTPLIRECMALAMEYDMDYGDVDSFVKQLHSNLMFQFDRADSFMWHGDDKKYTPGFNPLYGVTLLSAHRVLESIPQEDEKK